ncbi:MAG: VanZ family protein [Bellilinea sp.]
MDIVLYGFDPNAANLVPLVQTIRFLRYLENPFVIRNLLGNLILLAPMGIFLPLLFRKSRKFTVVLATGFLVTLAIEVFQLLLRFRVFDIDDLIINTIGVALGYGLFKLLYKIPFLHRWFDTIADSEKPAGRQHFISFAGVVLAGFLAIFYLSIISSTETEKMIVDKLPQQDQQLVAYSQVGEYWVVFSESRDGAKSVSYFRQVVFSRYVAILGDIHLDLQENEYSISGTAFNAKEMDYFAIARSHQPIAAMTSGGSRFPVTSNGEYHFSFARLPLAKADAYFSFHFVDDSGNDLGLSQDS